MRFTSYVLILGALFIAKSSMSQIKVTPAITHVSCAGGTNGSIKLTPTGTGTPYTYAWQPGSTTGNNISIKGIGAYSVTVTNASATSTVNVYNIGYKIKWQSFYPGMSTSANGDTLIHANDGSNTWLKTADGANVLPGSTDGWVEYVVTNTTYAKMFGFLDAGSGTAWNNVDFAMMLNAGGSLNSVANGTQYSIGSYTAGDVLRIERLGSAILYKKNGATISTTVIATPMVEATLTLRAAINSSSGRFENMGCSFPSTNVNAGIPQLISCTVPTATLMGTTSLIGGTYTWTPGGSAANSLTTTVTTAGIYTLGMTNPTYGCVVSGTVLVTKTPGTILSLSPHASAINCDGVDDFINPNAYPSGLSNNFTYEAWVRPTATHEIDVESTSGTDGTSGQRYMIWGNSGPDVGVGVSVGTNGVSVYEHGNSYMPALLVWQGTITNWTHIAVTYINKQPRLYINGVLVRTGLTSAKSSCYPYNILGGGGYGYYKGDVDEFRLWNTVRTQTQIQANMSMEITAPQAGLETYYKFNHGMAEANNAGFTNLTDFSGNNRTGSLTGFSLTGSTSNWISPGAVSVSSASLCSGTSLILKASGTTTYAWSTSASTSSIIVTPTVNTSYSVVGTTSGCSSSATITVSVNNLTANAGMDGFVTSGSNVMLGGSPSASAGSGSYTYSWTPAVTYSPSVTSSNPSVTVNATTVYTLMVTDLTTGCTQKDDKLVFMITDPFCFPLKKTLDGGYYNSYNQKIYVSFEEEYFDAAQVLTYAIVNDNNTAISSLPSQIEKIGDNRYSINLASLGLVSGKFYRIILTNKKNEVFYARFKY